MTEEEEEMWEKLSTITIPKPRIEQMLRDGELYTNFSTRHLLQRYLGYTKEEIDEFLDGYSSER